MSSRIETEMLSTISKPGNLNQATNNAIDN